MLKQIAGIIATVSLLMVSHIATAVEIGQLDQATVTVDSRSTHARNQALQQALFNVLLLNSGAKELQDNSQIQAALADASSMVVQYDYDQTNDGLQLNVTFDHDKVINLLRTTNLPVWGKQRPLTLVWLASDSDGERHLVSDESTSAEHQAFIKASKTRGIPLMFPLLDLDDLMAINVNDVRGQFTNTVAKASSRYAADYFAMVSFDSDVSATDSTGTTAPASKVHYQAALYGKSAESNPYAPALVSSSGDADSREAAIDEMMLALSDYFVQQYAATDSGQANSADIEFSNVAHMRQLVEIEAFFRQLTAVKHFNIKSIRGNHVIYQLQLFGSRDDLSNVLRLEQRIQADPNVAAPLPTDNSNNALIGVYRWNAQ